MKDSVRYGLVLGVLASIYLGVLAISGNHGGSALKYGKYIILMIGLILFFSRRINKWSYDEFIAKYIGSAGTISIITSIVIILANTVLYLIKPDFSIQKYTLLPHDVMQLITINGVILVETVVLGLLTAFIIFPYFKNRFLNYKKIHTQ